MYISAPGLGATRIVAIFRPQRRHGINSVADEAAALLARDQIANAQSLVARGLSDYGEQPVFLKLRANAECGSRDYALCVASYKAAWSAGFPLDSDERFGRDLSLLLQKKRAAADLGALIQAMGSSGIDLVLERTKAEDRSLRWAAIALVETLGHARDIDYLAAYAKDLTEAKNCKAVKAAARKLTEIHDTRAVAALKEARGKVQDSFFLRLCVGDAIDDAIHQLGG